MSWYCRSQSLIYSMKLTISTERFDFFLSSNVHAMVSFIVSHHQMTSWRWSSSSLSYRDIIVGGDDRRHFSKDSQVGKFGMFSIKLVFLMQATGCALRFVSSCLWIRIYRIGAATDTSSRYQPVEFSRRITNLGAFCPASASIAINARSTSMSDALLGGAIYHPAPSSHESCTDAINARPTSLTDELLKAIYNPAAFNSLRQSSSDEDSAESSEVGSPFYCSQVTEAEAKVCVLFPVLWGLPGISTGLWAVNKRKRI